MKTYVITGANRGIGFELTRQLCVSGNEVIALCRQRSEHLQALDVTIIEGIDFESSHLNDQLVEHLSAISNIDVIIHVAGVWRNESLADLNTKTIVEQFKVNALAPLMVTEKLLAKLSQQAKIIFITSQMGSLADNTSGGRYGYRMSKAALNMAAKSLAIDLKPNGISVAILHPGFVATDMTNNKGMPVNESVVGLLNRIELLNIDNSGTFWNARGEVLPW